MYDKEKFLQVLKKDPVVPVVVIDDENDAVPLAQALLDGGCSVIEITMRTAAALPAVELIKEARLPISIGVGTVCNKSDYKRALSAGVDFIVSPGTDKKLLKIAKGSDVPYLSGVMTSSEIMAVRNAGFYVQKFFPANLAGGKKALETYKSVYGDVLFFPTGGVSMDNLADFLGLSNVCAVGGTWIAKGDLLKKGEWNQITDNIKKARALAASCRA